MAVDAIPRGRREPPAPDRYVVPYRIRNHDLQDPARPVEVLAAPEEIRRLAADGYLVRPDTLAPEQSARLRAALDRVAAAELGATARLSTASRFGGLFLRHLADKDEAFLELLRFQPVLSVVRAVLGPQVQLRGLLRPHQLPERAELGDALALPPARRPRSPAPVLFPAPEFSRPCSTSTTRTTPAGR